MNIRNVSYAHRKHRLYGFPQICDLALCRYLSNNQQNKRLCYSVQSVFSVCETLIGHFADNHKYYITTKALPQNRRLCYLLRRKWSHLSRCYLFKPAKHQCV